MSSIVMKSDIESGLLKLGVKVGMVVEVHSSLHSFGYVDGGAKTLIEALMQVVGNDERLSCLPLGYLPSSRLTTLIRSLG